MAMAMAMAMAVAVAVASVRGIRGAALWSVFHGPF
jgi:hypothetical protein